MAEGFLNLYLGIAGVGTLLGLLLGMAVFKRNRRMGAVIGAIIGLVLGSMCASIAVFQSPPPRDEPTVVAE